MSERRFRFTKKGIEALPAQSPDAAAKEVEWSDTECVGLKVLVNKTGRKFFHLRYSFHKRRHGIKIGEFPATSLTEARQRANELKAQIDRGQNPQVEKQATRAIPLFKDYARET